MARKKVITEDDVKALEAELEKKKSALADMREKLNMSRIDNFIAWFKHNGIDPMQFFKLSITEEWGSEVKALYDLMTAPPEGVIKSSKPIQIEKDKVDHSESEDDDNQTEVDSDDDEDDGLSDSDDDDIDEGDNIDEDIDSDDEEDDGQQKLWN